MKLWETLQTCELHDPPEEAQAVGSIFTNYEMVKQRLEIHLCDMELNRDKIEESGLYRTR